MSLPNLLIVVLFVGNLALAANGSLPEYVLAAAASAMLAWGGFTWRRAEKALDAAYAANEAIDKLELAVSKEYLTKQEFSTQMDRLFKTLSRLETKLDYTLTIQRPMPPPDFYTDH